MRHGLLGLEPNSEQKVAGLAGTGRPGKCAFGAERLGVEFIVQDVEERDLIAFFFPWIHCACWFEIHCDIFRDFL